MKYLQLIVLLVILQSCEPNEDKFTKTYIIENNTEHVICIEYFEYGILGRKDSLKKNDVITEVRRYVSIRDNITAAGAWSADSVIITFDNLRSQVYTTKENNEQNISNRNLLFDSSYKKESDELYRFTFTEEDYSKALELEE